MAKLVYQDAVVKGKEFQRRVFTYAVVRFTTFFRVNLAYGNINGGTFVGNGWVRCNLFGLKLSGIKIEKDEFSHCNFGSAELRNIEFEGVRFLETVCSGGNWEESVLKNCSFQKCDFRKMRFAHMVIKCVEFQECIFDETNLEQTEMSEILFTDCVFMGNQKVPKHGCRIRNCRLER